MFLVPPIISKLVETNRPAGRNFSTTPLAVRRENTPSIGATRTHGAPILHTSHHATKGRKGSPEQRTK
jgi:hypothetical protein